MPSSYEYVKAWRAKNKDKVAAQSRRRKERKREHIQAQQKAWRDKNAEHVRRYGAEQKRQERELRPHIERAALQRYRAKLEAKLTAQAGRPRAASCELCGVAGKTVFDHCHATGCFRGWLCDRCNRTLGQVKDSVELLGKMIAYLARGGVGGGTDDGRTQSSAQ